VVGGAPERTRNGLRGQGLRAKNDQGRISHTGEMETGGGTTSACMIVTLFMEIQKNGYSNKQEALEVSKEGGGARKSSGCSPIAKEEVTRRKKFYVNMEGSRKKRVNL